MAQKIQMRRDSASAWSTANPVLARGEWGVAFNGTGISIVAIKIGDGESEWDSLDSLLPVEGDAPSQGEPFLIDGVALDSESGFWGQLFDFFGGTTGTWDNPEFPDGNSISLATPSVEQQTLGYTAKWKLNLSPLNRGQGLKGLHFSGAGVEGGDCAWLVTDASDVAVAGGEWNQGRKVDPGFTFGYPGKAIVAGGGDGSLTDMYFDNVIYPEEGEPFYLQLAMSHFHSPYEGVMSIDLIVTPIWVGIEEVYVPGNGPHWESFTESKPEYVGQALDLIADAIDGLNGGVWRTGTSGQTWPAGARTAFIFADTEDDPFTATLLAPARDGDSIDVFRADTSANELRILPSVDHTFASGDPYITLAVGEHVRLTWDTEGDRWFIAGS